MFGYIAHVRVLLRLLLAVFVAATTLGASVALAVDTADQFKESVVVEEPDPIELDALSQRSVIYAADGTVLSTLYDEDRVTVPLADIPEVVQQAVIAVEDASFYQHDGVSIPGIARAARENVESQEIEQGGSTLTQQLVKNELLDDERTFDRKLRELVLARQMEDQFTTDEILERYLNTIYFGSGAHGVTSAAERFFGKRLVDLTVGEAAMLAGLISNPAKFNPFNHPERARQRRAHALRRMTAEGFITDETAEAANAVPLPARPNVIPSSPKDHFSEEVLRLLLEDPRLGETREERYDRIFRGGLRIHTTLDRHLQRLADDAVRGILPEGPFTAAMASVDPKDGAVRAMVGGPGFEEAKFNFATQGKRQVGSAFKPIALAAWIANGGSPEDRVEFTAPCTFPLPGGAPTWNVNNYGGGTGGFAAGSLREATVRSYNCAYARLSLALGADKLANMAETLGVGRDLRAVPSIVLGTVEVTPLELAVVFATFAADGVRHEPMFIRRVENAKGELVFENQPKATRVIDAQVARTVSNVLRGVIEQGTGTRAQIGRPAAGKTGTNSEYRDAWFAGYTPQLATAVWMGHPERQVPMYNVGGRRVSGGSYPAEMWQAFMAPAHEGLPVMDFPAPGPWPAPDWVGGQVPEPLRAPPPPPPPAPGPPPPGPDDSGGNGNGNGNGNRGDD